MPAVLAVLPGSTGVLTVNEFGTNCHYTLKLLAFAQAAILGLWLAGCGGENTPVPTPQEGSRPISFATEDGVQLQGRIFGKGQTGVVLAHMFPADQTSWWEFAQALAAKGYTALTFDFRGYGDSGGPKEIRLIDLDVEAALEYLGKRGASGVYLIGASMGGTASLKVAARRKVAGVVSLSAPVDFQGIDLKGARVDVPVLVMASEGDGSAMNSLNRMFEDDIVGELARKVVYEGGSDHGTDILKGENANAARAQILTFLEAHQP